MHIVVFESSSLVGQSSDQHLLVPPLLRQDRRRKQTYKAAGREQQVEHRQSPAKLVVGGIAIALMVLAFVLRHAGSASARQEDRLQEKHGRRHPVQARLFETLLVLLGPGVDCW